MKITFQQNALTKIQAAEKALLELGCTDFEQRDDGTLYVRGTIHLSDKNIRQLPDFSMVHLEGNFYCENNPDLKSLIGAPYRVELNFFCGKNKNLSSLVGAPEYVGSDFSCPFLPALETLEGAPRKTGLNFICSGSPWVSTLKGSPREVGGFVMCKEMPRLASLEDAPQKFMKIISDFGAFESWEEVPEQLKVSDTTRQRIKEEAIAAEVRGATILQTSIKINTPLKLRGVKP